jgi:phytoene desaturase
LVKNNRLLRAHKVISLIGCTSGVDEFIAPDNLAEIETTLKTIEEGMFAQIHNRSKKYDIAIKDLVYRPGVSPLELVTVETTKKIGQF